MTSHAAVPRPYVGVEDRAPSGVLPGQQMAEVEADEAVLFVIGMRFNRLRKVRSWWPVFVGMPKMLKELEEHPEEGLLHARSYFSGRQLMVLQYWRSAEDLGRYAKDMGPRPRCRRGQRSTSRCGRQWGRRHLPRDLHRAARGHREPLRQHAADRPGGRFRRPA